MPLSTSFSPGRENLELVGLWYHLPKSEYRRRAQEILERLDLTEAANRRTDGYSGGMRRRLDIGASLLRTTTSAVPRRADDRARSPDS